MKCKLITLIFIITVWVTTANTPDVAAAQMMDIGMIPQLPGGSEPGVRPPLFDVRLESSYTAAGKSKYGGANYGNSDAYNVNLGLSARTPLNK
ncbi:MAG: hypothetical protein PHP88_07850 [bacterium]|nr:hypothetical protein [bacterium]